jgi:hypothetical protein
MVERLQLEEFSAELWEWDGEGAGGGGAMGQGAGKEGVVGCCVGDGRRGGGR